MIPPSQQDELLSEDDRAFDALYLECAPRVLRRARAILKNAAEAEEIVQEVFLQAWLQQERYDHTRGSREAWLLTLTHSRAIDWLRARQARGVDRTRPIADRDFAAIQSGKPDGPARLAIRDCIRSLSVSQRLAIELAFREGYTHTEIARLLRQPLGTVKTRIRLALLKMRDGLEKGALPAVSADEVPFATSLVDFLRRAPSTPRRTESLQGTRVLVVDDHRDTCDLVTTVLESAGATVNQVTSTAAAEAQLATEWPDVMLADIMMPGVGGYVLMRRARTIAERTGRSLRAAAFTALSSPKDRAAAFRAGFDMHLPKPAEPHAIVQAIAELRG